MRFLQALDDGPLGGPIRIIRSQLPPINFITIHYLYFLATCLLTAIIFWGSSTPARSVTFTDSLFLTISAMSGAGLNTINLSTLNTFQQIILFLLIMVGSPIFVSAFVVHVRKKAFEKKFEDVIERGRRRSKGRSRSRGRSWSINRLKADPKDEASWATVKEQVSNPSDSSDGPTTAKPEGPHVTYDLPQAESEPDAIVTPEIQPLSDEDANRLQTSDSHTSAPATGIRFSEKTRFGASDADTIYSRRKRGLFTMQGVGAMPSADLSSPSLERIPFSPDLRRVDSDMSRRPGESKVELDVKDWWVSRNSQFHGLTEKERERLGGYEYRAVSFLSWLVPTYIILWQLLGCAGCAAWIAVNRPGTARANALNPGWVGAFNAVSAFNNSGMSLLDANMTAFQTAYYLLITMSLLILAGNTCYPIFLRLIVWCMYKITKSIQHRSEVWAERAGTLRFLLDHPRRCYTNLFPAQHTWWLLFSVVMLNGVDWAAFEILDIGNKQLTLPAGVRTIDGLFQAFAVRSGGFYVVTIPSLRISLLVLYVVMMYISVYPVTITMRNSNVYEERSLGIYSENADENDDNQDARGTFKMSKPSRVLTQLSGHLVTGGANSQESNGRFVRQQLRAQLAHDAWWIVAALFLIMIIEGGQFERDPVDFSVFNFIFEIVSAYGCVGISIGVPGQDYSFSGAWHILSKLILCVVMIRGRHRGLPVAIDKAVLLPGEDHWRAEEDDGRIRRARTMSRGRPEVV